MADLGLFRFSLKLTLNGLGNFQGNLDLTDMRFNRYATKADLLNSVKRGVLGGLTAEFPSMGCEVVPFTFQDFLDSILSGVDDDPVNVQKLDAGPALSLTGPIGAQQLPRRNTNDGGFKYAPNNNGGILGGGIPGLPGLPPVMPDYLQPGAYTLNDGSGAVVGPFSTFSGPCNGSWSAVRLHCAGGCRDLHCAVVGPFGNAGERTRSGYGRHAGGFSHRGHYPAPAGSFPGYRDRRGLL